MNQPYASGKHLLCSSYSVAQNQIWIFDFGATDHICSNLSRFLSYTHISPIHVKLPNSSSIIATIAGLVSFSDSLILSNVLYLPEFSFNLIPISKLSSSLNCSLIFNRDSCQILEESSKGRYVWVKKSMDYATWYLPK